MLGAEAPDPWPGLGGWLRGAAPREGPQVAPREPPEALGVASCRPPRSRPDGLQPSPAPSRKTHFTAAGFKVMFPIKYVKDRNYKRLWKSPAMP